MPDAGGQSESGAAVTSLYVMSSPAPHRRQYSPRPNPTRAKTLLKDYP
jgi:hypothetical protein